MNFHMAHFTHRDNSKRIFVTKMMMIFKCSHIAKMTREVFGVRKFMGFYSPTNLCHGIVFVFSVLPINVLAFFRPLRLPVPSFKCFPNICSGVFSEAILTLITIPMRLRLVFIKISRWFVDSASIAFHGFNITIPIPFVKGGW